MVEWFNNLSDANKIAIIVPVGLAVIVGLFKLCKWLLGKNNGPALEGVIITPPDRPE